MDTDSQKNHFKKLFYRPIEIAIRWCEMMNFENIILRKIDTKIPIERTLASFPNLLEKIEILNDAIRNKELSYGFMGITTSSDEAVEQSMLTIRHNDLKRWFIEYHPSQQPDFIFDETERQSVPPRTLETYKVLLLELGICKAELERTHRLINDLTEERDLSHRENANLIMHRQNSNEPNERAQRSYLRLIGALITLLLGKSPSGKPYSRFSSQSSIISVLTAQNEGIPGFNKRTLEERFAAANRINEGKK
ncbi:hypothetical protein BK671_14635 [Pseudomonas fluorescens]|uniref:Receptor protein-tyrosine kinase n=2 Tax=Pseudomonas fluorescens TaxID=294 RepID=A0A423LFW6_PSEFL|nr:hypothetical protein BK671_14635 [Pseudomonas fluorescens]